MASLCFEPKLVVTDTAAILNKAFRSLIVQGEGVGYNNDYLPDVADFDWLIKKGHIEFAARDDQEKSFARLSEEFAKKKRNIDLPSEGYAEKLDDIYHGRYMHRYNINEAAKRFTYNFRDQVKKELENKNTHSEITKTLQDITYIFSDKESLTYNLVKNAMKEKLELKEADPRYQHVRRILRQAYDYNIPELLKLDYCRSLQGIMPSRKTDWRFELDREKTLEFDFDCSVYGLAALPSRYLNDIWGSDEGIAFGEQLKAFRADTIELEEYVESLRRYIVRINDIVKDYYGGKYNPFSEKGKLARLMIRARQYFCADSPYIVIAKTFKDSYNKICDVCDILEFHDALELSGGLKLQDMSHMFDLRSPIIKAIVNKVIPNVAKKLGGFPDPPEEMSEAVVMKTRVESDSYDNTETE